MPDYAETRLTSADERVYFKFDAANDPTEATTTLHASFTELGENSTFDVQGAGDTGDGQAREDRGNKHPMPTNSKSHDVTFDLKQRKDTDPYADHEFDLYKVVGLLKVKSSGHFIFIKALIDGIRESGATNGMPTWEGTAKSQGPVVRGKITVWPPAA